MALEDYLAEINRNRCSVNCRFKDRGFGPAIVPPPRKIFGIVISNDPPVSWWHFYQYLRREGKVEIRRKMLFTSAIPLSLLNRILDFKKWINEQVSIEVETNLFNVMFEGVYWTHMHKCFTDKRTVDLKPQDNVNRCANQWLSGELSHATIGAAFVLALGGNAHRWISRWRNSLIGNRNLEKVNLPHPSRANVGKGYSWRPRQDTDRSRLRQEVNRLIGLCSSIVL